MLFFLEPHLKQSKENKSLSARTSSLTKGTIPFIFFVHPGYKELLRTLGVGVTGKIGGYSKANYILNMKNITL